MKICSWGKDGGYESTVWGFWLIEIKSLFSIVLLKFEDGTREAYHNHAFDAVSWVLGGGFLNEQLLAGPCIIHNPGFKPIFTYKDTSHKVRSAGTTWVLSFRGPWRATWNEFTQYGMKTLTHGRREV